MESETRQILTVLLVTLLISCIGILISSSIISLLEGDLVVDTMQAEYSFDGSLTETYQYQVRSDDTYRSLNRNFLAPVSMTPLSSPYVRFIGVTAPKGAVGYMKDYSGKVTMEGGTSESQALIRQRASNNEAGAFKQDYYQKGSWSVLYTWQISPPVERGIDADHLNIDIATSHIPYSSVRITFPADNVISVYPHPADLTVTREGERYILTGSAPADVPLGFELLLTRGAGDQIHGIITDLGSVSVIEKTSAANPWYGAILAMLPPVILTISQILLAVIPVGLFLIWYLKGREIPFTVPEHLSVIPDPSLKPWMVTLIFEGDPQEFGENGLYATLLDMHRQGLIKIEEKPGETNILITLLKTSSPDAYEQTVLTTLGRIATDGVLDTGMLASMAETANSNSEVRTNLLAYQEQIKSLNDYSSSALENRYIEDGRGYLVPLLILPGIWILISIAAGIGGKDLPTGFVAALLAGLAVVEGGIAILFPATLFGRWKGNTYAEKLQWDSFRSFLSDAVLIRRYAPSDIRMWGEWLVYGTALGVGDQVMKSMKDLKVTTSEFSTGGGGTMFLGPALFYSAFRPVTAYSPPSSSSGIGGGGGFGGGGGGFGGGGAGGW
ncbi:MAG TPA: DUF2207 domain-containing protein [Methanospirillum sp.]|nr:DUF2207 domain-containing protein [Methanospirillum sp.]